MVATSRLALATLFVLGGCVPPIPEGHFGCAVDEDCPPEMVCRVDRCFLTTSDAGAEDGGRDGGRDAGRMDAGDGGRDAGARDAGADAAAPDAGPPDAGPPDAGPPDAPPCVPSEATVYTNADTALLPAECNGANHRGSDTYLNVGLGRGIFAFALPAQARTALEAGRVYAMHLTLTRDPDCGGLPCPVGAGALRAHPVVADWVEGSDGTPGQVSYAGADWCRRLGSAGALEWESPGAMGPSDIGPESGRASVTAGAATVTIPLAPSAFDAAALTARLSVLVAAESDAVFVTVAREQMDVRRASLHLAWCP